MRIALGIASVAHEVLEIRRRTEQVWLDLRHHHREAAGGTNESERPSVLHELVDDGRGFCRDRLELRYEPFNMGLAYAFVDGQWLTCTADAFLQVQGRTEREWELILDEWREQQRAHHRKRMTIDSARLAAFLEEVLTEEALLAQQQRDLEGVSIREAIVGQAKTASLEPSNAESELDEELDLTTLPKLEEYC